MASVAMVFPNGSNVSPAYSVVASDNMATQGDRTLKAMMLARFFNIPASEWEC